MKGIIVSIQDYTPATTNELANEAVSAGAVAIRTDQPISVDVPVIGLRKIKVEDRRRFPYITSSIELIKTTAQWADYVAIDYRKVNKNLAKISDFCEENKIRVIADIKNISDYENILQNKYKYDFIATTFSVFKDKFRPDVELIETLKVYGCKKIIAEGNYKTRKQVSDAFSKGASSVCIGAAISNIYKNTRKFTTL